MRGMGRESARVCFAPFNSVRVRPFIIHSINNESRKTPLYVNVARIDFVFTCIGTGHGHRRRWGCQSVMSHGARIPEWKMKWKKQHNRLRNTTATWQSLWFGRVTARYCWRPCVRTVGNTRSEKSDTTTKYRTRARSPTSISNPRLQKGFSPNTTITTIRSRTSRWMSFTVYTTRGKASCPTLFIKVCRTFYYYYFCSQLFCSFRLWTIRV